MSRQYKRGRKRACISYPTVKTNLKTSFLHSDMKIIMTFHEVNKADILEKLDKGKITVDEAVNLI